ncbi:MAG: outer membrane beta-barrel family protein [Paramuribaculum sp.]|nr:outer membrane beta-barrel family protein [Paramuribaculum sp.]
MKSLERNRRFSFNVDGNSLIRLLPNNRRAMLTIGGAASLDNQTPNYYTYRQLDFKNRPGENSSMLQHNDGSPYRDRLYKGYAKYNLSLSTPKFIFELKADYDYTRDERTRTSQFYQGELQEDYLIPSLLPQMSVNLPIDYDESYRSRQWENRHSLNPSITIRRTLAKKTNKALGLSVNVPVAISQRMLDYHRGAKEQHISSTRFLYETSASLFFQNQPKTVGYYMLNLGFNSSVRQPHLLNMVDVVDDTDPMNVILGNPDLCNTRSNTVSFGLYTTGKIPGHQLSISYTTISNAISQGYYLISSTAQRISRPYNVDGNRQANVSYGISWSKSDTYWLSNTLGGGYQRSRELIGAITDSNDSPDLFVAPPTNVVNSLSLSDRFEANYNFSGKYNLRAFIDLGLRKYRSAQSTFVDDLTFNGSYGVSALLNLPSNWSLGTDLTFYTRTGYSYSQLNTTDLLWNARVTKSFLKGLLVCAVDGYDLLRQLSNVSYTVNAQYRIETVTNVMPSYLLFSLQYRFNSQPQRQSQRQRQTKALNVTRM